MNSSNVSTPADGVRSLSGDLTVPITQVLKVLVGLLLLIGFLSRISPLLDMQGRLYWQHISEDGYLMQTVARNMAIGLGMSTAEGTMPTNGVQPLATFAYAALHYLAAGSRQEGIALVIAFSSIVAALTVYFFQRLSAKVLGDLPSGRMLALLIAALWFAAPRITAHSMNGLETGIYLLAIVLTWNYYLGVARDASESLTWQERLTLGLLLGLTFLARNDAVFFIAAILLAHAALGGGRAGGFTHRLIDSVVAGLTSMVVALPWLIHNKIRFGSIVPISGSAQSFDATFGQNLRLVPANWFEAAFVYLPIPASIEKSWPVVLLGIVATAFVVGAYWLFAGRQTLASRRFFVTGLLLTLFISTYYGAFFGAPHFLSRYTSPLSPFLWICAAATAFYLVPLLLKKVQVAKAVIAGLAALMTVGAAAFAYGNFVRGRDHMHKQVVDWVQENVGPKQWVGAPQTGTLGFFHDRTINLDGKVNPDALKVLLKEGHILNYVVDSKINYIVDWADMAQWVTFTQHSPRFTQEFEVVVHDPKLNLAALRRIHPVAEQP